MELSHTDMLIGRDEQCDLVIDSRDVSRRHARLHQDLTGRWKIEDLDSSNGTFVNGERVESAWISPDDVIEIGPASLSFSGAIPESAQTLSLGAPNIIIEDFGTEVFYDKPRLEDCDRVPWPERLAQIKQRLSKLTDVSELHGLVCRLLAQEARTAAAVFRVSHETPCPPQVPALLACHFGSPIEDVRAAPGAVGYPSHLTFRVSHRLLEAVRKEDRPLMTKSIFSCDTEITLSIIDEHSPRALICVPLNSGEPAVDLLYVDVPIDRHFQPGPEEMFVLVQAVAQQIQHLQWFLDRQRGATDDE